jgi:hypothetical protein
LGDGGVHDSNENAIGKLADNLASTNAALERMERVVDYLIKRDGEISR